jgi:hypothetical protein
MSRYNSSECRKYCCGKRDATDAYLANYCKIFVNFKHFLLYFHLPAGIHSVLEKKYGISRQPGLEHTFYNNNIYILL